MGSIQSRLLAIGYRTPSQRDNCRNCAKSVLIRDAMPWPERECKLYGFRTKDMAVCSKHEPKVLAQPHLVNCDACPGRGTGCEMGHCAKGGDVEVQ